MVITIVAKCESRWHEQLCQSLAFVFDEVHILHINELIKNNEIDCRSHKIVFDLSKMIMKYQTTHIMFDLEFSMLLSPWEVNEIANMCAIPALGWGMDDDRFHDINRVMYTGTDAICTTSLSFERYRMIGVRSFNIFPFFELAPEPVELLKNKEIDVLFYGLRKSDRDKKISFLEKKGINVYCVDFKTDHEQLVRLIRRSKIVLNFSGGSQLVNTPLRFVPFLEHQGSGSSVKQLKSRIFEVGNFGSLCVSEDFPLDHITFPKGSLPTGSSIEELSLIIEDLLKNEQHYNDSLQKFQKLFSKKYNIENRSKEFNNFLLTMKKRDLDKEIHTPVLYSACILVTKFIYQRNIMIFNPFKIKDQRSNLLKIYVLILAFIILGWVGIKLFGRTLKK